MHFSRIQPGKHQVGGAAAECINHMEYAALKYICCSARVAPEYISWL